MELNLLRQKFDSDTSVINKSKNSTIDKEVQTSCSKTVQTSLESGNTESDKSIDDFEKLLEARHKLRNNSNNLPMRSKCKNDVDFSNIQGVSSNVEFQNQNNNNFNVMGESENPLGYVLNTLHQENTYLKAFTTQVCIREYILLKYISFFVYLCYLFKIDCLFFLTLSAFLCFENSKDNRFRN